MSATPRPLPSAAPRPRLVPGGGRRRIASASAWTLSSMAAMSAIRLVGQIVLSYLCLPEHFGVVTLMRTFLTLVEMASDMGLRNAVISHPRGEERGFLGTAASVQLLRGGGMWLLSCGLAWPAAAFYHAPVLLVLLPLAGLESLNNGLYAVRAYVAERDLRLAVPTLLEALALVVSIATSVVWCALSPGPWGLALGPLVGGFARTVASHAIYRAERVRFGWDAGLARELFRYSRWILGSTTISFVAQQFHLLYLAKFVSTGLLGVYGLAWNLCAQASKPMTALANKVLIPHLSEAIREGPAALEPRLRASQARFLPACLLVALGAGLFAPAMFGLFYDDSYVSGGEMGELFAIVVWFMVLQHVPRCTLLSLGDSRSVAAMAAWNAGVTVLGVVGGYALGSVAGAIVGNALGNVAGCVSGWRALRAQGIRVGREMSAHSALFLALLAVGALGAAALAAAGFVSASVASLGATAGLCTPVALWVWFGTIAPLRARRSGTP